MSKDTFYFSHDYNTRNDPKIKSLIRKHGLLGYGLFWAIVEDLYNNANALPTDYESIAFDLRTESEIIKSILNDFSLFVIEGETFGSLSIQRRIDERNAKSNKARDNANKRWNKDANALPPHSDRNAIKESKVKKKKVKESNIHAFIIPEVEEVISYFQEKGYTPESAKKAFEYYNVNQWKDSKGQKVINWKQKMISVWFKDENKAKPEPKPIQVTVDFMRYDNYPEYVKKCNEVNFTPIPESQFWTKPY